MFRGVYGGRLNLPEREIAYQYYFGLLYVKNVETLKISPP